MQFALLVYPILAIFWLGEIADGEKSSKTSLLPLFLFRIRLGLYAGPPIAMRQARLYLTSRVNQEDQCR